MTAGTRQQEMMRSLSPEFAVTAPARREIEQSDLRYAHACRAKGWGWQAIAQQLRVNQTDLRRACGDLPGEGPRRAVAATPSLPRRGIGPVGTRGRAVSPERVAQRVRILDVLGDGPATERDLVAATGLAPKDVRAAVVSMSRRGLLKREGEFNDRLRLTDTGAAAQDVLETVDG